MAISKVNDFLTSHGVT